MGALAKDVNNFNFAGRITERASTRQLASLSTLGTAAVARALLAEGEFARQLTRLGIIPTDCWTSGDAHYIPEQV